MRAGLAGGGESTKDPEVVGVCNPRRPCTFSIYGPMSRTWSAETRGDSGELICPMLVQLESLAKYQLELPQADPPWPSGTRELEAKL